MSSPFEKSEMKITKFSSEWLERVLARKDNHALCPDEATRRTMRCELSRREYINHQCGRRVTR